MSNRMSLAIKCWNDKYSHAVRDDAKGIASALVLMCAVLFVGCAQVARDSAPHAKAPQNCADACNSGCGPSRDSQGTWMPATLLGKSKDDVIAYLGAVGGISEVTSDELDAEERTLYWFDDLAVAFDKNDMVVAVFNFTEKWVLRQWRRH